MESTSRSAGVIVMMDWDGWGMGGWGYALMALGMIAFWGLLIAGIVLLVRAFAGAPRGERAAPPQGFSSAEELLAQRYARGEIDTEEYRTRLDILQRGRVSGPGTRA